MWAIIEQCGVNIRHVAPVLPAQDPACCQGPLWRLIQAEHEEHATDEVNHEIAGDTGPIFLPAAPTRKEFGIERTFWHVALPGVPIDRLRGKIGRQRILPGSIGTVSSKGDLAHNKFNVNVLSMTFLSIRVNN